MFGNMLGDMEERQKEMRQKLAEIIVEGTAQGGAVKVVANANREITDIRIDREKLDWEDVEMVQDLVLDATNKALAAAAAKEAEATQEMVKNMLPPGMGDLGNLFG
ncbi:MAG: YbaB/EbfC family nucleoid-associated protein [bacterium]|jgi:DNA-binding YbaB/EbfC family protein|nr:YbaB/EbfC family nucleoid-associated protein [bacterium]